MTTKQYLLQIKKINEIIKNRMFDLDELRDLSGSVSSVRYDQDKVITSGNKNQLENIVARIVDLDRQVKNYIDLKYTIIKQIESLDSEEYKVLYMRFVNNYTFDLILARLNTDDVWSERKMYQVYKRGLDNFEKMYGELYLAA